MAKHTQVQPRKLESNTVLKRKARYEAGLIASEVTLIHRPQPGALEGIPYRLLQVDGRRYRSYQAEEITRRFNQPG